MARIYKLIQDNIVVYVGKTEDADRFLSGRVTGHRYEGKTFDSYELIEETDDLTREAYWVQFHWDTCGYENGGYNKTKDGLTNGGAVKVRIYNDKGFSKEYTSIMAGARELELNHTCLGKIIRGVEGRKQHKGYKIVLVKGVRDNG